MSKKAGLGVLGALAVGIGLYYILKNQKQTNPVTITAPQITAPQNTTPQNTAPQNTEPKAEIAITPKIVSELQDLGITQGSAITNIIHGGTPCNYRGTNGKCYSSREEAERNGAA